MKGNRTPDRDVTRTEGEGETLDMPEGMRAFRPGQVLGERYEIIEMLGRGGMGEVWYAFDLKLRVEVALKALRPDFFRSEDRRELLRQEVRAAREVVSPNVCRIFDLIEIEGRKQGRPSTYSMDKTICLWPMPDLSKPPLHTLPREELIAKLETLTNLRVVRDPESSTGWTLTHDPFPGWETVPTW